MSQIGQSIATDLSSVAFYKSPVFYIFITYVVALVVMFHYTTVDSKFVTKDGKFQVGKLLMYPHGFSTVPNIIKTIFTGPISLYLLIVTVLMSSFVEMRNDSYMPYFYGLAFSYLLLFLLFMIHSISINKLMDPATIQNSYDSDVKTYNGLYRTQWYYLTLVSPIYSFILTYIGRKM